MKILLAAFALLIAGAGFSQEADAIYADYIKSPQLFVYGNQLLYPIIHLNSNDKLELHFDDLQGDVKNYFYTYQLCTADWSPVDMNQMDFIRGFYQVNINSYKYSSIALTRYTHYQALVPELNCVPSRSGNYLLKVFLDNDTSKLVFTRRFLVVQDGASIAAQVQQPLNPMTSYTHQKIQFIVNTGTLNIIDPLQQLKIAILQNYRWDNAIQGIQPSFYSGNSFEYNSDDNCIFPAGKEWRWLDIQSFRFQSDRVQRADYQKSATSVFVKPDQERARQIYYAYSDLNGLFYVQTSENINPLWQTDYATVHFSFVPGGNEPYPNQDVYLLGKFTDYHLNDQSKMSFNVERGIYEVSLLLKQGFYNYMYVTAASKDPDKKPSFDFTEGNHLQTENDYTILVYYRDLGGRADRLVALAALNSTLAGR